MTQKTAFNIFLLALFVTACKKKPEDNTVGQPTTTSKNIYYQSYTTSNPPAANGSDSTYYDVDGDSKPDIVAIRRTKSLSGGGVESSGKIYGLSHPVSFTYLYESITLVDSTTVIGDQDDFVWMDTLSYAGGGWQGIFLKEFGFTFKDANRTYGWFRLDKGQLTESGYNRSAGGTIRIGQKK